MGIYLFILSISILIFIGSVFKKRRLDMVSILIYFFGGLLAITMVSMYFFRGETVGTDYPMYNMFFRMPTDYLRQIGIENAFIWLYDIAEKRQVFFIVSAASFLITNAGLIIFSNRVHIPFPLFLAMTILSYEYMVSYNMLRQMVAIGIIFGGLAMFIEKEDADSKGRNVFVKKYLIYMACVFIATQFHNSATVALILPFCQFIKITPGRVVVATVFTVVGFISDLGNRIVPTLSKFFPHYLDKYNSLTSSFFTSGSKGIIALLPVIVQFIFLFLICTYNPEFINKNKIIVSIYFVYLLLYVVSGNNAAVRIQSYWMPSTIYFYGKFVINDSAPTLRFSEEIFSLIILMFFVVYTLLRLFTNNSGVVPFIWQNF